MGQRRDGKCRRARHRKFRHFRPVRYRYPFRRRMQLPLRRLGRRRRTISCGRHHMDDAIAARLQLAQDPRQRFDRARLNVVQQQDAFALGFQPLDRKVVDPAGRNVAPVVGGKIGAPESVSPWSGDTPRSLVAAQAGDPQERRRRCAVPSAAVTDAMPCSISCMERSSGSWCMPNGWFWVCVATVWPASRTLRTPSGLPLAWGPTRKNVALDAIGRENVQHLVAVFRQRAVIERQHHLVIFERQRLGILHGADERMRARVDHDGARRAEASG